MFEQHAQAHLLDDVSDPTPITCATYDATAESYAEATEDYLRFPGLRDEVVAFERSMPPGLPALDLGCGGGRDSRLLAELGRTVIAADFSMPMLQCARSRTANRSRKHRFVRLHLLDLPFPDGAFGGIWASGSILHLPSGRFARALSEVHRTLAPGGIAAISMRNGSTEGWRDGGTTAGRRWFTFVEPDEFSAHLAHAGFGKVEIRITGRQDWFVALGYR